MKANLKKEKYIFIIGGSLSGIGKGIFTAALTSVLQVMNFSLIVKKVDPYLSTDTGFMNPYEHGEVFVTSDGEETDLDLGHYQRFSCLKMDKWSSITSGKIYSSLISKEREGLFLGQTVRVIPHLVNEITS